MRALVYVGLVFLVREGDGVKEHLTSDYTIPVAPSPLSSFL